MGIPAATAAPRRLLMTPTPRSRDATAPALLHARPKRALVLRESISRRGMVRRSLEAEGYLVGRGRGRYDLTTCRRVSKPDLVVVGARWLERRAGVYSVMKRMPRQVRVEVVELGGPGVARSAQGGARRTCG